MRKTILTLASAAALATAGIAAAPQPAHAVAWWVAPAIVAGAIGGVAVGATAANANAYGPRGDVYVQPTASCRVIREQDPATGRWHRMRVCN